MAATALSKLLQGSNFTSARRAPRTTGHQRIPSGVERRSAPSSVCFRDGSGRRAAVVCALAAAGDRGAPAAALPAALLFDCDGVLVDTEKDGHRISFNETFAERELGVSWDVELYGELLEIGGGKERMTAYFNKTGWPAKAPKTDEERKEFISALHKRKTELFMALIEKKLLPLRPGVQRLIDEALGKGVRVAVCSTSNEKAVSFLYFIFIKHAGEPRIFVKGRTQCRRLPHYAGSGGRLFSAQPSPHINVQRLGLEPIFVKMPGPKGIITVLGDIRVAYTCEQETLNAAAALANNRVVDSTAGSALLCFLDWYPGYYQRRFKRV
ncbi:unnamed protein product [Urochloa decumbens]|uniref:Uncharacterized protein n=1 Tax=Urochloa decumbens TaxID=240449 RepID=A0ABC9H8V8_9POAL